VPGVVANPVQEINTFPGKSWIDEFSSMECYKHIPNQHQHMVATVKDVSFLKAALHHTVYEMPRTFMKQYGILDTVPYYYIKFLLEQHPKIILDLGCGENIFKTFIPGIVGMDSHDLSNYDIKDFFDEDYTCGHQQAFDAIISINSIHFAPVTEITQRLKWVASMIRPGNRGFVATSLETWLMYTDAATIKKLFGEFPDYDLVIEYVNHQIINTGLDFIVVDWPILHVTNQSGIRDTLNGNIRLVFNV